MKINKFIYVAVVGALFASCQSVETPMFSDKDAFVAFDNASTTIEENANKEIQIPVSLVASKAFSGSLTAKLNMLFVTIEELKSTVYCAHSVVKVGL